MIFNNHNIVPKQL